MPLTHDEYTKLTTMIDQRKQAGRWNDALEQEWSSAHSRLLDKQPDLIVKRSLTQAGFGDTAVTKGPIKGFSPATPSQISPEQMRQFYPDVAAATAAVNKPDLVENPEAIRHDLNKTLMQTVAAKNIPSIIEPASKLVEQGDYDGLAKLMDQAGDHNLGRRIRENANQFIQNTPAFLQPVASGIAQGELAATGIMARIGGGSEASQEVATASSEIMQARKSHFGDSTMANAVESTASSLVQLALSRGIPGGTGRITSALPAISTFTATSVNDALNEGESAGLTGTRLAAYAARAGGIEAAVSAAFSAVGLGGLENVGRSSVRAGLKGFAKEVIGELSEENIIEVVSAINRDLSKVDPTALDPDKLGETLYRTTVSTLLSMGIAKAPGLIDNHLSRDVDPVTGETMTTPSPLPESTPQAVPPRGSVEQTLIGETGTTPAQTPLEQQFIGQQATDPTPTERDQFFGTGVSEPSIGEQARFFSERRTDRPERPEDRTAQTQPVAEDRRQGDRAVPAERRTSQDRRTPDMAQERDEIATLFKQGNVEEAQARISQLQDRARRDPKGTGLLSGVVWDSQIDQIQNEVNETGKSRHVAVLDVANLGLVNTVRGHIKADQTLQKIADAVIKVAGPEASFRTGGDEMGIIFPPGTTRLQAKRMMTKIEKAVGFDQVVEGASSFIAGEIGTLKPGGNVTETMEALDHAGEARKRKIKEERGEPTSFSKDEALQAATVAQQRSVDPNLRKSDPNLAASKKVAAIADEYVESQGMERVPHEATEINPLSAKRLARAYDTAKHEPDNPQVKASYEAFTKETLDQFNYLKSKGYVFEMKSAEQVSQDYPDVAALAKDVADNRHLSVSQDPGDMPADHPMMAIAPGTGGLTHNQVFRAVHDIMGHAQHGHGFDIAGEENAWRSHSTMYSDTARGALATETRGQSTWVGYGPRAVQNRKAIADGDIPSVTFPPQKATLLPSEFWTAPGLPPVGEVVDVDQKAKLKDDLTKGRKSAANATPIEGTSHKRRVPQGVEDWITPLSSRVRDISARIYDRLMRMEFNTNVARERLKKQLTEPARLLTEALGGKNTPQYEAFKLAVLNGDQDAAYRAVPVETHEHLDAFYNTFRTLLDNMREAGVTIGDLGETYWARYIRDHKAFKAIYGKDQGRFEEAWDIARAVQGRRFLTAEQKAEIANSVIQGYGPRKAGSYGPANARTRTVEEIPSEALSHYIDPFEAAFRYIDGATYAAERSRFLGRNHSIDNLDDTIGKIVEEEVTQGRLTNDQQQELHDLLKTRFTADMLNTSKWVRNFKQLIYLTTLGQFRSTLTQLTDAAFSATTWNIPSAVKGAKAALGFTKAEQRLAMEDIGVHDHGEEFKDIGRLARATDWTLRKTGFSRIDRFGKESRINTALAGMQRAAANPNSFQYNRITREYADVLGESWEPTLRDLRNGQMTEDVRYLLFLDISKIQPVVTSQMPVRYLEMPNGRILYSLKTFTLTQLDFVRRDMVRKLATRGQRSEGARNLARYAVMFTMLGMGVDLLKDWLRGKEIGEESVPDRAMDAMLGMVGLNRYTVEKAWTSPSEAALNYVAPPLSWMDAIWTDVTTGGAKGLRSIRNIPIVGELMYYWAPFGRGYQLGKAEADTEFRKKLKALRSEARQAHQNKDMDLARTLVNIYNVHRKEGPGDGRSTPITLDTLRTDTERKLKKEKENSQ